MDERRIAGEGAKKKGATHYVIVATSNAGAKVQYFTGSSFKSNLMLAARFRTEAEAHRRCEKSVYCHRMKEAGGKIDVRGV